MSKKGKCGICHKDYTKIGFTKHLQNCISELSKYGETKGTIKRNVFLLMISTVDKPDYFLYILIDRRATLEMLDDFLRGIWLECCDNLSKFTIDWYEFMKGYDMFEEDQGVYGLEYALDQLLEEESTFSYDYDFGSTTELILSVKKAYEDIAIADAITVVARNLPLKSDSYNSPRNGVDGYIGDDSFDPKKLAIEDYQVKQFDIDILEDISWTDPPDQVDFTNDYMDPFKDLDEASVNKLMQEVIHNLGEDMKLRDNKRPGKYYISEYITELKPMLEVFNKSELSQIVKSFSITGTSSYNKAKLIDVVSEGIISSFLEQLKYLTYEQLQYYSRASKFDGVVTINRNHLDMILGNVVCNLVQKLYLFPMLDMNALSENISFRLPSELCQLIKTTNLKSYEKQASKNSEYMKMARGYAYYYGIVPIEKLRTLTNEVLQTSITSHEFMQVLETASLTDAYVDVIDDIVCYCNVFFLTKLEYEIKEQEKINKDLDYKILTRKELDKVNRRTYFVHTKAISTFEKYLKEYYEMKHDVIYDLISNFLNYLDCEGSFNDAISMVTDNIDIPDEQVLSEIMYHLSNIYNNHRQWVLKGHSPYEVGSAPIDNVDNVTPVDFVKKQKIGRNDPCPCGSNRKYKHCCGKNV